MKIVSLVATMVSVLWFVAPANAADLQTEINASCGHVLDIVGMNNITKPIQINCGMTIQGSGWMSGINNLGSGDALQINSPDQVIIADMAIIAPNPTKGAGIVTDGPVDTKYLCASQNPGFRVRNVLITNHENGIYSNVSCFWTLTDSVIWNFGTNGVVVGERGLAPMISNTSIIKLTSTPGHAVYAAIGASSAGSAGLGGHLTNNTFYCTNCYAIMGFFESVYPSADNYRISNNVIEGQNTTFGIVVSPQGAGRTTNWINISNNDIGGVYPIYMQTAADNQITNVAITGNHFIVSPEAPGACVFLSGVMKATITGNTCNDQGSNVWAGVALYGNTTRAVVANNVIGGTANGVVVAGHARDVLVQGNDIGNRVNTGVLAFENSSRVVVLSNYLHDLGTAVYEATTGTITQQNNVVLP